MLYIHILTHKSDIYKTINEYNKMRFIYVALFLTVAIFFNFPRMVDDSTQIISAVFCWRVTAVDAAEVKSFCWEIYKLVVLRQNSSSRCVNWLEPYQLKDQILRQLWYGCLHDAVGNFSTFVSVVVEIKFVSHKFGESRLESHLI